MRFASLLRNRRTDQAFKMSRLYATVAHAKREGHEAPCLLHSRLHRSHFMKWLLYLFCRAEYGGLTYWLLSRAQLASANLLCGRQCYSFHFLMTSIRVFILSAQSKRLFIASAVVWLRDASASSTLSMELLFRCLSI